MTLHDMVPDPEVILALEPEELAGVLLEFLHIEEGRGLINRYNIGLPHVVKDYTRECQHEISSAIMEAWMWLEKGGLVAPKPGDTGQWYFITRKGERLNTAADLTAYRSQSILPRSLLHDRIQRRAWPAFLRGDYDTAVFQAFKEVEVSTRSASGLEETDIGVNLMRKAFHPKTGPLSDDGMPDAEKEALGHLFAGAVGLNKNPQWSPACSTGPYGSR